jgi:nicotinamidase-related amidase
MIKMMARHACAAHELQSEFEASVYDAIVENMPEIKLEYKKTALVVIDMQKGIASMSRELKPYDANQVIRNVAKLTDSFRKAGAATALVHVNTSYGKDMLNPILDVAPAWNSGNRPSDWAEFVDQINPSPEDIIITKRQWGAFHGTELDLQLRRRGVTAIVLCGISTNIGVETTAREAYQLGYNQVFAIDAMSAFSNEEHDATLKFIFPKIGILRNTEQVLDMLV